MKIIVAIEMCSRTRVNRVACVGTRAVLRLVWPFAGIGQN